MKILILTDRFYPEISAPSVRILDHARVWKEEGHEVIVVTTVPNLPRGVVFEGYRNRLYQEEWIEGVRTIRVWSYMTANEGFVKRSLDYASLMVTSVLFFFRYPRFDVILASSPPIFVAIAGYLLSRLRRRPWIFEVRDLWPASIKAVGAGEGRMIDLLERLEIFLYRKADRIISLTRSFKKDMSERGIDPAKNDVVTNGVDAARFNPERAEPGVRERLGVRRDAFLAGYIGTTGMAHGLMTMVEAAEQCREDPNIRFLIMGDGAERGRLEAEAERRGLENLLFRDFVPHDEMPSYLGALDASIVHLRPDPVFETVIPSKIFESMAMGVPIVMAVQGEAEEIVRKAGAGLSVASGDPKGMADAVRRLASEPSLRESLARAGPEAVRREYSRTRSAESLLRSFGAAIEARNGTGGHHG